MTDLDYLRYAAKVAATQSHDNRTQNGAVLAARNAVVWAANRFPKGVEQVLETPQKYAAMEHAERAAIYAAAKCGWKTNGATMYALWFACPDCARAIINAGVAEVIGHIAPRQQTPDRWMEQVLAGEKMLRDAGVAMRWLAEPLGVSILFDGRRMEL